jgi:glycosyltransferase involved in cell wall biosynthesis
LYRAADKLTGPVVHVGPANLRLPALHGGAVERRMIELAAAQSRELGLETVIYSRGDRTEEGTLGESNIRYLRTAHNRLARRVGFPLSFARDVARLRPAAIHIHNCADAAPLLRFLRLKVPVVLTCDYHLEPLHSVPVVRPVTKLMYRQCLSCTDVIAPVSGYCSRIYREYWGVPASRVAVIPNGVDLRRFRPDPQAGQAWRKRLGLEGRRILLYVGRICRQKGSDLLAKAAPELTRLYPDCAVVAVGPNGQFGMSGDSPLIQDLQRAGVVYVPPVADSELPGVYNMADLFVMPTRELEMFGMAAVEAEACGLPVLASNHGGLCETVPESAGARFEAGSAEHLVASARLLLSSAERLRQLSDGARKHAEQYDWKTVATICEHVYLEAARRRAAFN